MAILRMLIDTGMRAGELAGLRLSHDKEAAVGATLRLGK